MGMLPEDQETVSQERGLFPLPRLCAPPPCFARGGHRRRRHQRLVGRIGETNRILGRLEQVVGGRLEEAVEERHAPKASDCGRSVRADALAQVWSCVVRHDPPRPEREGVDDLNSLAEESEFSAVNERCDIVGKDEAFADWVSCPEGTVGSFEPVPELSRARRDLHLDIKNAFLPEEEGKVAASLTGAYMGFNPTQYTLLVARILRIGMCRPRR